LKKDLLPSRRYVFFGLAALSLLMFAIDSTIVAVAIPTMTRELNTSLVWIGWTLTAYALTQTVMMPLSGKLAESFGRMRVFVASVVLFTLGSLLCGLAPNVYLLILFRVLQAVGGGGFMPSAIGIVAEEFPENRDRMVGLFTSIFPIGGIIGPNLGGLIIEHASWRYVFFVNVPIGILVIAALAPRLRRSEATHRRRIDLLGTLLYGSAIVALLSALTFLGNDSGFLKTPYFWALLAASLGLLGAFVWQERRATEPVIELGLVTRSPFNVVNLYNFLLGAATMGFFSFIPYFAVVRFHMGTAESGAILTPRSLAMIATSIVASLFLIRLGYRLPMILGMLATAASLALLALGGDALVIGDLRLGPFWIMSMEMLLAGFGMGLSAPASNNAALDLLPGRTSVITGLRGMFRSTGGVLGVALIVLGLEFSPDKAEGLSHIFLVIAAVMVLTVPLALRIPDTARTRRKARRLAEGQVDELGTTVKEAVARRESAAPEPAREPDPAAASRAR
jgi:EmrB/QacA subfamily drug resistance transporter